MVEDGVPFCRKCSAPQIRVVIARESGDGEPGAAEDLSGQDDERGSSPTAALSRTQASTDERRITISSALMAGALAGLGSLIPFVPFITLSMIAAGGLADTLYKRRRPYASVPTSRGFRLGSLAGFFGFLLNAFASLLGMLSEGNRSAVRAAMEDRIKEAAAMNADPSAQQMLKQLSDWISTPSGLAAVFAGSLLLFGLVFIVLSGIGGGIGAALFGKKSQ